MSASPLKLVGLDIAEEVFSFMEDLFAVFLDRNNAA
jgi:hypothetical protein